MKGPAYTWINSRKCLAIEYMKPIAALLLIALLFLSFDSLADVPAEQKAEVEYLINYLQESDCRMVRNGKSYDGADGANHVRRKYSYFRDKISSTEDFIEYSATRSTMSGKYYLVECPGEESMRSQDWLLRELQVYRRR